MPKKFHKFSKSHKKVSKKDLTLTFSPKRPKSCATTKKRLKKSQNAQNHNKTPQNLKTVK